MVKVFAGSVRLDSVGVEFDDERLLANAGLILIATLSKRLGIESLVDKTVRLGERAGASRPGRKVLTLIHAIAAGADSIDDTEVLRTGGTEALLGHRAMAPSTLGTFLPEVPPAVESLAPPGWATSGSVWHAERASSSLSWSPSPTEREPTTTTPAEPRTPVCSSS